MTDRKGVRRKRILKSTAMTKEEQVRRMKDKGLFERCMRAFPKEMAEFKRDFAKASARRDNAKLLRLMDKYCRMTLRIEPKCELQEGSDGQGES